MVGDIKEVSENYLDTVFDDTIWGENDVFLYYYAKMLRCCGLVVIVRLLAC